jgi:hypothetical protein
VADERARELERAAVVDPGDAEAQYRALRDRARRGGLDPVAVEALDLCLVDGDIDECRLEVLQLALAGDLTHGSWIKVYEHPYGGKTDRLLKHAHGYWWCVSYWYQGYYNRQVESLRWLEHFAVAPAAIKRFEARHGYHRWVSPRPREVYRTLGMGLDWLARYLSESWAPGQGQAIWRLRQSLKVARAKRTKLSRVDLGAAQYGPGSWSHDQDLREAQAEVERIKAELRELGAEVE